MDGRRGQDGWGKYTRRRKWYRDAELVEINPDTTSDGAIDASGSSSLTQAGDPSNRKDGEGSDGSQVRKRGFFRRSRRMSTPSSSDFSTANTSRNVDDDDGPHLPTSHQPQGDDWNVGDDVKMGLG